MTRACPNSIRDKPTVNQFKNDEPEPALKTKTFIPVARPKLVARPQLIARIEQGFQGALTSISAPAGFGKTTLLSQCATLCRHPIAWVSLDQDDNDPILFWTYVIAAIQTLYANLGKSLVSMLRAPQPISIEQMLTRLINEITEIPERFGLVLDDFHLITDPEIHKCLNYLIDNLPVYPKGMHLIVSGRADLPIHLARLRGRGELTEIRSGDLRFTNEEATVFLNNNMGLALSAEDVAALEKRTEGWVTGLQMAAISMRGRSNMLGGAAVFIQTFTGSHRFILDYLIEEVLNLQTNEIKKFLLQTSILDQMTAGLCDHVAGFKNSQDILLQLERENLFLVSLDDRRCWYRYHHLFADLLYKCLTADHKDDICALHQKASEWYEQNGMIADAVGHSLKTGDIDGVARLIRRNIQASLYHTELSTILRWLQVSTNETTKANPWLEIAHAWTLFYLGRLEDTEKQLEKVNEVIRNSEDTARLLGQTAAIRGYIAAIRGEMDQTIQLVEQALALLPAEDHIMRGFLYGQLNSALRWKGFLPQALKASEMSLQAGYTAQDTHTLIFTLVTHGVTLQTLGRLNESYAAYQQILILDQEISDNLNRRLPIIESTYRITSKILYEWNDIETSLRFIKAAVNLSDQWGGVEGMAFNYLHLAKTLQATGDSQGALRAMEKGKQAAGTYSAWFGSYVAAQQAALWLEQGNQPAAFQWSQECNLNPQDEPEYQFTTEYSVLIRVLAAQNKFDDALMLLEKLLGVNEKAGALLNYIPLLVLKAVLLQQQGEEDLALTSLYQALRLAAPENFIRSFVDEGKPIAVLLQIAATKGLYPGYVSRLLEALNKKLSIHADQKSDDGLEILVEPLSEREHEVLKLLDTPLSATEIAQQLYISPHTVRTHIKSIYAKLGVHKRLEAVQHAQKLDLI